MATKQQQSLPRGEAGKDRAALSKFLGIKMGWKPQNSTPQDNWDSSSECWESSKAASWRRVCFVQIPLGLPSIQCSWENIYRIFCHSIWNRNLAQRRDSLGRSPVIFRILEGSCDILTLRQYYSEAPLFEVGGGHPELQFLKGTDTLLSFQKWEPCNGIRAPYLLGQELNAQFKFQSQRLCSCFSLAHTCSIFTWSWVYFPSLLLMSQMSVSSPDHSPEIQNQLSSQHLRLDFRKNLKLKMSKPALISPSKKSSK